MTPVAASIIGTVIGVIFGLAYYVWYAIALSKTFPKLGKEGWRGWVPVLNEIEILILGGVPGWSVIFYFIPIVQLYGIYLKVTAVHRINRQFQRGAGMTVLGILLPPVWASILAWGRTPAPEFDQRVTSIMPAQPGTGVGPLSTPPAVPPTAPTASDYVIPPSGPVVTPPAVGPAAPIQSAAEVEPAPADVINPWAPRVTEADRGASTPVYVPAPIRPVSTRPAEFPPVAPDAGAIDPAPVVPPPVVTAPVVTPPAVTPPVVVEPVLPTVPSPVEVPDAAPDPTIVEPTQPAEPSEPAEPARPEDDEDEYAATVVVDRRPRVQWKLVLDSGRDFDLTADRVALGRNPVSDDPDAQLLSVPDSTRTLSKTHATLEFTDGQWTVTDLHSTNGVIVVGAEDAETLLAPGRSSAVPDRFILGKVGMRVERAEGVAK